MGRYGMTDYNPENLPPCPHCESDQHLGVAVVVHTPVVDVEETESGLRSPVFGDSHYQQYLLVECHECEETLHEGEYPDGISGELPGSTTPPGFDGTCPECGCEQFEGIQARRDRVDAVEFDGGSGVMHLRHGEGIESRWTYLTCKECQNILIEDGESQY